MTAELDRQKASQQESERLSELAREQRFAEAEREMLETRHHNLQREAELEAERATSKIESDAALRELDSIAREAIRRRELEIERLTGEVQSGLLRAQRDIDNSISEDRIQMTLVEQSLPAMAQAFAQQFGEVKFTQIGGEGSDPSAMIARSLAQIFEMAKSLGLRLGNETD